MASVDEFRADALGHPGGMMIVDRVLKGMDFSGLKIDYGRHETKPYFSWIPSAVSNMNGACRLRSPGRKPPS